MDGTKIFSLKSPKKTKTSHAHGNSCYYSRLYHFTSLDYKLNVCVYDCAGVAVIFATTKMCRMPNKKKERTSGEKNAHTPTKPSLTFDWQIEFIFIVERRNKTRQQQNIGTYFMAMEKMIMLLVLVGDYHHHHFHHHHHHLESGWFIKETAIKATKHSFPLNTGKKKQTAILNGPQELRRLCCFGSHPPWLDC